MTPQDQNPPVKFTKKQQRFIAEYCVDMNATQAAIRAGYSPATAKEMGYENLTKLHVKQEIDRRLDALSMKAGEATQRLTAWGRGSFEPFVSGGENEEGMKLDLSKPEARKNIHLIKKMKQTKRTLFNKEGEVFGEELTTEIELYDAMDAVKFIAKVRGLTAEKTAQKTPEDGEEIAEVKVTVVSKKKDQNPPKDEDNGKTDTDSAKA